MSALPEYLWLLAGLSLIAVGGANAVLPELHTIVTQHGWISSETFTQLFAIAQAAPGPNVLVVGLIGWKIAGVLGAVAAVIAMCGPSSLLAFAASRAWTHFERARARMVLAATLTPISVGLILGSGITIARAVGPTALGIVLVAAVTLTVWRTNVSPLALLAAGAAAGLAHLV
jgi:chromate transporter